MTATVGKNKHELQDGSPADRFLEGFNNDNYQIDPDWIEPYVIVDASGSITLDSNKQEEIDTSIRAKLFEQHTKNLTDTLLSWNDAVDTAIAQVASWEGSNSPHLESARATKVQTKKSRSDFLASLPDAITTILVSEIGEETFETDADLSRLLVETISGRFKNAISSPDCAPYFETLDEQATEMIQALMNHETEPIPPSAESDKSTKNAPSENLSVQEIETMRKKVEKEQPFFEIMGFCFDRWINTTQDTPKSNAKIMRAWYQEFRGCIHIQYDEKVNTYAQYLIDQCLQLDFLEFYGNATPKHGHIIRPKQIQARLQAHQDKENKNPQKTIQELRMLKKKLETEQPFFRILNNGLEIALAKKLKELTPDQMLRIWYNNTSEFLDIQFDAKTNVIAQLVMDNYLLKDFGEYYTSMNPSDTPVETSFDDVEEKLIEFSEKYLKKVEQHIGFTQDTLDLYKRGGHSILTGHLPPNAKKMVKAHGRSAEFFQVVAFFELNHQDNTVLSGPEIFTHLDEYGYENAKREYLENIHKTPNSDRNGTFSLTA